MDNKRNLWINQLGYLPQAPKICVAVKPPQMTFEVQTIDESVMWKTVFKGEFVPCGDRFVGDFSAITKPADYRVICGEVSNDYRRQTATDSLASNYFVVKDDVYSTAERMFLQYYTWQRCGSAKGWAGVCHQELAPLVGTDRLIDVCGGYHQSGDLRIWAEGISLSLYALLRYMELKHPAWDTGELAEELRWGCDYFLKLVGPEGYAYDSQFTPIGWGSREYYVSPAPLGAQMNIVQLLARASRYFRQTDDGYAERCLQTARTVWRSIETNDLFDLPYVPPRLNLPRGTQGAGFHWQTYRKSAAGLAGRASSALELYLATQDGAYKQAALDYGGKFLELQYMEGPFSGCFRQDAQTDIPAFSDCSYNYRLNGYRTALELYRAFGEVRFLEAFQRSCERFKQNVTAAQFNGIPSSKVVTTSASLAGELAILLSEAADCFHEQEYNILSQRCLDWLFGVNPEEASYITGIGYRHKQHLVFGQFFPSTPQIPGGVVHVMGGEYDMPAVAMALWACGKIS